MVVLGGHGFVGKAVVRQLKKLGHKIFPLSRENNFDLLDFKCIE